MGILEPIPARALAVRLISQVAEGYARTLGLRPGLRSLGLLTADNDDATFVAIDDATKMADVEVVYAHSFYAGARHASGPLSGEIIAMLAGPDPSEVSSGLDAAVHYLTERALWYSADERNGVAFFPHVVPHIGTYLAQLTGLAPGAPVAYLVAPAPGGLLRPGRRPQGGGRGPGHLHRAPLRDQLHGRHPHRRRVRLRGRGPGFPGRGPGCRRPALPLLGDPMDPDLLSIQEARDLASAAKAAQEQWAKASQEQVDRVCAAMAEAGAAAAADLGAKAHAETGYGDPEHKRLKNLLCSSLLWDHIRDIRTVGVIERDDANRLFRVAQPMGVVAALVPSTNPTSTAFFKTMIAVKARDAIVISPHPSAAKCTCEAAMVMADAAVRAGAPRGLVGCMSRCTLQGTNELMRHKAVALILATGGTPMVRARPFGGQARLRGGAPATCPATWTEAPTWPRRRGCWWPARPSTIP